MNVQELCSDIRIKLDSLDAVIAMATRLSEKIQAQTFDEESRYASAAVFLNLYNGIENIFKRVHKFYSVALPHGEASHQELLERFVANTDGAPSYPPLPTLVSAELFPQLFLLKKLRHVVAHGYSHLLRREALDAALVETPRLYAAFKRQVETFLVLLPCE